MQYTDACKIPAATGSLYNDRCRYQDASLETQVEFGGDENVKGVGLVFFPYTIRLAPDLTIEVTFGPTGVREVQTGRIAKIERVGGRTMAVVQLLDVSETTTLGTIDDLSVLDNGAGSVALIWTSIDGATSYQAQMDASDEGAAVDETTTIIVLTGLAAGAHDFTVDATDGTDVTNSNTVNFTVT